MYNRDMKQAYIGEPGTEQFTVKTRVNGKTIATQPIHDPFISNRIVLRGWRHAWNALTKGIEVDVSVRGTEGAQRAIMALEPASVQRDTEEILAQRAASRNGEYAGTYAASS